MLPFLKERRWPRIAPPMDEKSYGLSSDEQLEDACMSELMDAVKDKDPKAFLSALEALVRNCFQYGEANE